MVTPAIKFLQKKEINFELLKYEHKIKGAKFAAESLDVPLKQMIKTIILKGSDNKFYIALIPGNKDISLKKAAKILNLKNIKLASTHEAEKITGYKVGGISPFGVKKTMKVIMENSLSLFNEIYINGGKRGYIIKMKLKDLIAILNPEISELQRKNML